MANVKIKSTKIMRFEAAHYLPGHKGLCAHIHGHSYKLEVTLMRTSELGVINGGSSDGMVMDFSDLKGIVNAVVIEKLDHNMLNDAFACRPTAELMAASILQQLNDAVAEVDKDCKVSSVVLWETENSRAEAYYE